MEEVVKNLNLYASFFEEDKFVSKPAYSMSPITIQLANPEKVKIADKVEFQFSEKDSLVMIGTNKYPLNQFINTAYGNMRFSANKFQLNAPEKQLYLAIGEVIYEDFFQKVAIQLILSKYQVSLLVINMNQQEIVKWIA